MRSGCHRSAHFGALENCVSPAPSRPSSRRNVLFSAAERGLLTLLTLVTSPLIVHGFGEMRFGILSISMTTLGFLAFLDLGITAAAVRELAQARGAGDELRAKRVFSTALGIYVALGMVAGTALFALAPWLVHRVFHVDAANQTDALLVMRAAGVGLGLNLMLAPMTTVPRALQRLDISTMITISVSVITTVGLVVAARANSLSAAVAVQLLSTAGAMVAYFLASKRLAPELRFWPQMHRASMAKLGNFAAFQLLSQIFGTLAVYADRLILAAWLTPADVTYYSIPAGLSQKIHVLMAAAAGFVFPRVAELLAKQDRDGVARLYGQGVRLTMLVAVLLAAPVVAGGHAFLHAWMGIDFANQAAASLRWTALAYACFCATVMPVLTLLGLGKSRTVAAYSLLTGVPNVVLALVLVPWVGRDGAGLAMLGSMCLSFVPMFAVRKEVGTPWAALAWPLARLIPVGASAAAATWLAVRLLPTSLILAFCSLIIGACVGAAVWWFLPGLPSEDAAVLRRGRIG